MDNSGYSGIMTSNRDDADDRHKQQAARNVLRSSLPQSKSTRVTADSMTRKQEALLKNRLKNLVKYKQLTKARIRLKMHLAMRI